MPIHLRNHHAGLRGLFPHPPAPPAVPRANRRHNAPAQHQDNRHYFRRPLHCQDHLCHATFPPRFGVDPGAVERFMAEQWELAAGSAPSIASQHQTRRVVLAAREQKYGWMGIIAWFFGLIFGVSSLAEETLDSQPSRPLGEVLWEGICHTSECVADITGCAVGRLVTSIRKVDWDRLWKLAAFIYIAYIWGQREEEIIRMQAPSRARALSELSQSNYKGVRYTLVEDMQGWCKYSPN